jgi:hypothetical protein
LEGSIEAPQIFRVVHVLAELEAIIFVVKDILKLTENKKTPQHFVAAFLVSCTKRGQLKVNPSSFF